MARRRPEPPSGGLTWCKSFHAVLLPVAVSPYRVTPARIGNSSGLRLPAAFYRDHPQFAGAAGQVEVLDDSTLLLRLDPEQQQEGVAEEESLMLGLFLDFLSRQALTSDPGPVLYTEAMAADDDELLDGVTVDAADELSRA
jgi:antitoxin PrlF